MSLALRRKTSIVHLGAAEGCTGFLGEGLLRRRYEEMGSTEGRFLSVKDHS